MTGSSGGQPAQQRKVGLYRQQRCSPDAERGLGDWAVSFRSRQCDAERWLLVVGSWDCDWRCSNCPWGSCDVLVHVSQQNTVASLCIDKSVQPNETSSGSSESWSRHLTPWKHLSCGWYNPTRRSFHTASWTVSMFQHLFPHLPFAPLRVPFSGHWLWPWPFCQLSLLRKHLWTCGNNARRPPCSSIISNNPRFRLKHPGVPDGSDSSGGTSYPLTENQTRPFAQVTCRVPYLSCGGNYTMPLILATCRVVYYARRSGVRLPLLCVRNVVTYTHRRNDTYVTLFAGVVVMQ